uniref:Putative secreted protein n=1 Tax=Ixodes ricinus TaxID=34613 RepID=A0A6B0UM46_IXORI
MARATFGISSVPSIFFFVHSFIFFFTLVAGNVGVRIPLSLVRNVSEEICLAVCGNIGAPRCTIRKPLQFRRQYLQESQHLVLPGQVGLSPQVQSAFLKLDLSYDHCCVYKRPFVFVL